MGTAKVLANLKAMNSTFLVINGDVLMTLNNSNLIEYHRHRQASVTIAVTEKRIEFELGVLRLDAEDHIMGYDEKPVKHFTASLGIYVYEPDVLELIDPGKYLNFPTLVLRVIECGKQVVGYCTDTFWLDNGNREDYEQAVKGFENNPNVFLGSP